MGKAEHSGNNRKQYRSAPLKRKALRYFLIVTDTKETEELYLKGFHKALKPEERDRIVIKVRKAKYTGSLVRECQGAVEYLSPNYEPWILFDRDEVADFDRLIRDAMSAGIGAAWSNPCIEIWFQAYYGELSAPGGTLDQRAKQCCDTFRAVYKQKTGKMYRKNDRDLYQTLNETGDEDGAIRRAERRHKAHLDSGTGKPSDMCPCTTVYQLIKAMRGRTSV